MAWVHLPIPGNVNVHVSKELTCVYVGVFLHIGLLVEALPAVLAGVGPGVRVDQQVRGQRARPLEAFAALLTLQKNIPRQTKLYKYAYIDLRPT